MKRGQLRWWEDVSIALGLWLFALVALWPRRGAGNDVERLIKN